MGAILSVIYLALRPIFDVFMRFQSVLNIKKLPLLIFVNVHKKFILLCSKPVIPMCSGFLSFKTKIK